MALKVKHIMSIMESYAPVKLKESYDNVGLMIGDKECEVTNVLVALDCTMKVIEEAIERNCNLIVTHHPILFRKPNSITTDTLLGKKIIKLISNNINVYASHTNLDSTPNGINEIIMKLLHFESSEIINVSNSSTDIGVGRIVTLETGITLEKLINLVKVNLNISNLRFCGEEDRILSKIAIINGSGQDYIAEAIEKGAECIVTGDTTYHYFSDYSEENIAIIDAGHFDTEWPAMKVVAELIEKEVKALSFNNSVLLSKANVNPYKFK